MSLLRRTLGCLKPYLGYVAISSFSAAIHALMAGLFVWLAGPLLMTLFQVSDLAIAQPQPIAVEQAEKTEEQIEDEESITDQLDQHLDFLAKTKNNLKSYINEFVIGESRKDTLYNFCLLILGIAFISNLFLYLQGFFMAYVHQSITRDFRNNLFKKYQQLSLSFFHKQRTGKLISRVTNDVVVLNAAVDLGFNRLIVDSLTVVILSLFLILLSWKLTLLAALVLPLVFSFIYWMGRKLRKYSARSQEKMSDVNSVLEETVSNIRIVKAYAMEQFEIRKFFKSTGEFFKALLRMARIRHLASPINEILIVIAGISILFYAGTRIIKGGGEMDAGDFMTFIIAMFSLVKPIKNLLQIHVKLQEGMAASERIYDILDTPITIKNSDSAQKIVDFKSTLKYVNVTFGYQSNEDILKDISFEVQRGEVLALVGPSGAGKSTLFDLFPRFYDPRKGRITIDGINIKNITLDSLRGMLGIVTQETYLFNDTIRNNIAYGLDTVADEDIVKAATAANAHDFIKQFDTGYDTIVGNRGVRLSGGQRQRIAIARALLKNPQILIFDEATSALDSESELLVQEAIDRLMVDRTALVIAHRLSTIVNASRILVLDKGRIIEEGKHDDLMKLNGHYHRLYLLQFKNGSPRK